MKSEIIKVQTDTDNGIELRLVKTPRGLVVCVWDIDCDEPYEGMKIFPYENDNYENVAHEYFETMKSSNDMGSMII